jgi:hypothetical protein
MLKSNYAMQRSGLVGTRLQKLQLTSTGFAQQAARRLRAAADRGR